MKKTIDMEIETLKVKSPFSEDTRNPNPALFTFDLPTLVEKMKHSHSWTNGELNAIILLKTHGKQIVLTALHKGTEIKSFQANDSLTLQIIEGEIKFQMRKESVTLNKGQKLTLHENIKYSLITRKETVFLLVIVNDNLQQTKN